ncbi:WGR domain-containing protein [Trichocoleus sp. FACHB-90]|uniref:WGR domain-containing protein n=1 Tax=Cyanophyceae TaxID=3028117 RepID=UPI0016870705|nr:WGR domain-containing protein [Trichocoleus sp. FACHB-90]MBD1928083.1 WGR domain-containing protein [Trichocoleus sp. FACHB-90]
MSLKPEGTLLQFVSLEYINLAENSNKFWRGSLYQNGALLVEWGRIGTRGQSKVYECASVSAAQQKLNKLHEEKVGKGYRPTVTFVSSTPNPNPTAVNNTTPSAPKSTPPTTTATDTDNLECSERSRHLNWKRFT